MIKKVVVFDSGYGGELFADYLEKELAIIDVVRVIDWRHADDLTRDSKTARRAAAEALRPYIGRVDLIVFANNLLALTSLKFFQRKYHNQKFSGLKLPTNVRDSNEPTLILTTKAVHDTIQYHILKHRLKSDVKDLCLDGWPNLIDDGELTLDMMRQSFSSVNVRPSNIIIGCTQFVDIKKDLHRVLGNNIVIYDSFKQGFNDVCKKLGYRGGSGKKD